MGKNDAIQSLLYTVVRLRTRLISGDVMHGTAFVFEYQVEENTFPFLISAKSLVETAVEGRMLLVQGRGREPVPNKNYVLDIDNFGKLWYAHPDYNVDVAITPFVPFVRHVENTGTPIYFQSYTPQQIHNGSESNQLAVGESLYALGFPEGFCDDKLNVPMIKVAPCASMPWLPYRGVQQILLDATVSPGWIGAPVLRAEHDSEGIVRLKLLGMFNRVRDIARGESDESEPSDAMSVVIKSDVVIAAIATYLREKGFI